MAGLIQQSMQPGAPAPDPMQAQMPPGQPQEEAGADPDSDPSFAAAIDFAMRALYEAGAAKNIAESLKSANDKVDALANLAYEITAATDEKTEGAVPDELFALLGIQVLQEVADIGEAAGIQLASADVAGALKIMILRFVGEQGMDATQLQAEMDKVDPAEFERMANEAEGAPA